MATTWCIVERERWSVLRSSGRQVETFPVEVEAGESLAAAIARCLKAQGYGHEGVLLGLASSRAAVAEITPELEEVRRDPQAMALALESELPWAAEEFVADFVAQGTKSVGVALKRAGIQELVEGLESAGVWVASICPWVLVRMQRLALQGVEADALVVLAEEETAVSLIALQEGRLATWQWLPTRNGSSLQTQLEFLRVRRGANANESAEDVPQPEWPWVLVGGNDETWAELSEGAGKVQRRDDPIEETVVQARRILSGRDRPWVEWRRGALADPRPYRSLRGWGLFTALSGLVALGLLVAAIQVRAERYNAQAIALNAEQTQLFEDLMPGQKVPVGMRMRLESELVKLRAERGQPQASAQLVATPEILEHCITALPMSIRLRVKTIEVVGPQVLLDCETLTFADSALLVDALTQAGFEVAAPRTELLGGLVPLKLTATWKPPQGAATPISPKGTP